MLAAWTFGLSSGSNGGWTDVCWTFGTGATLAAAALVPLEAFPSVGVHDAPVAGGRAGGPLGRCGLGLYIASAGGGPRRRIGRYAKFRDSTGASDYARMLMLFVSLPQAPATALLGLSVIIAARTARATTLMLRDVLGRRAVR